jgi:phosphatidate cytidylyltransferase
MSFRELAKRLGVAAFGIPLALYLVWMGGWPLALVLSFIAALGAREFFLLMESGGVRAFTWIGMAGSVAMVLVAGGNRSFAAAGPWAFGILMAVFLASAMAAIWLRWPQGNPLTAIPATLAGVLYTGGTLSFALFIRHLPDFHPMAGEGWPLQGLLLLAFPIAVTWMGDSAAYFFGYAWGNRKLMPAVSPGKTVVGGVAGLCTATVVGGVLAGTILWLHPNPLFSAALGAGAGLLMGGAAQLGDLVESVLKREAGVKDSGSLLPGHGGILDRFDALYFSLPLAYVLLRLVGLIS